MKPKKTCMLCHGEGMYEQACSSCYPAPAQDGELREATEEWVDGALAELSACSGEHWSGHVAMAMRFLEKFKEALRSTAPQKKVT